MDYVKIILLLLVSFCCACSSSQKMSQSNWHRIWHAEFNEAGAPNPAKWAFAGRDYVVDWNRYCTDSPEVAYVKNGSLHLRGIVNTSKADTAQFKTGCIETRGKFSFRYGKIQIRAKLPNATGSWPAIWLMPQKSTYGGWPRSGEIDIMEHLNADSIVYQTVHSYYIDVAGHREKPPHSKKTPIKPNQFNVYGLVWTPNQLNFYVNGQQTFSYARLDSAGSKQWPFDQKFYIILDHALGGNWVGAVDEGDLPAEMLVDWIRVYKKQNK